MSLATPDALTDITDRDTGVATLLDAGLLPVEELALLGQREGWRPRPIYQVHRWFARRFGSAVRALLTAAATPVDADFWTAYYKGTDWHDRVVLDPFVGGGTSVVEARRLGAQVYGFDVDAVACAITRFELGAECVPDLTNLLEHLKAQVGEPLSRYYKTVTPEGETREVLHFFWVQVVSCRGCNQIIEAQPHHQLAYETTGQRQWVFCPSCHHIHDLDRTKTDFVCEQCGTSTAIHKGTVKFGRLTCPHCGTKERLIDVSARVSAPPQWRIFALETLEGPTTRKSTPLAQRRFRSATRYDHDLLQEVEYALQGRRHENGILRWVPDRRVPREGRSDNRLPAYGYDRYSQLFNIRQLLHLSCLAEAISALENPVREAMALAFSDHLTTNCMMTHYAFGWRRLAPLFSLRAYRHVPRPVEINPWLDGTGRGTFPNAVRQVQRAISFARSPQELLLDGGFCASPSFRDRDPVAPGWTILKRNAQDLSPVDSATVDLVLTDPPYFDNIAYSELSDFFLPWLQLLGLVPSDGATVTRLGENLAAKHRDLDAVEDYRQELGHCFQEIARVLKPTGRLVFTYQHQVAGAWLALASALAAAKLQPIQLFPLLGDGQAGLHAHEGNSRWDAVFVAVVQKSSIAQNPMHLSRHAIAAAQRHSVDWSTRLTVTADCGFREADKRNFQRACLVAGALGMFALPDGDEELVPLDVLLTDIRAERRSSHKRM